jgi:imidazolonepropionase-like amidohydrolase
MKFVRDAHASLSGLMFVGFVASIALLGCGNYLPAQEGTDSAKPAEVDENDAADETDAASEATESDVPGNDDPEQAESTPAPSTGPITVLQGATLLTVADAGLIENGTIVIQDGQIIALGGSDVSIPADAKVIDATGLVLTPGLIDVRSQYGLDSRERQSISDGSAIATDGFNTYNDDQQSLLSEGVTSVYVQPTNASLFGGLGSLVSVSPNKSLESLLIVENSGAQAALANGSSNIRAHYAEYARLKKTLDSVAAYKKKWDEFNEFEAKKKADAEEKDPKENKKKSSSKKSDSKNDAEAKDDKASAKPAKRGSKDSEKKPGELKTDADKSDADKSDTDKSDTDKKPSDKADDKEDKAPKKPKFNPVYDRLTGILSGDIPLHVEVHTPNDTANALKLKEDFEDIQLVLTGLSQSGSQASDVTDSRLPIVLGPWLDSERTGLDDPYRINHWVDSYAAHEGLLVIASFGNQPRSSAGLRTHAAVAVSSGWSVDAALEAITINAARLVGADDCVGSLAVGKRADIIAFTGHPLKSTSAVAMAMVHGQIEFTKLGEMPSTADTATAEPMLRVGGMTQSLPSQFPNQFAVRSRRVWIDGEWLPRSLVVRNGKIANILPFEAELAAKLPAYDLGDVVITPGLITAHSLLGNASLLSQSSSSNAANVSAFDALGPQSDTARELIDGGFLYTLFAPPATNTLAGSAVWTPLTGESNQADENSGLSIPKIVLTDSARSRDQYPSSLAGQIELVQSAFNNESSVSRLYVPDLVARQIEQQRRTAFAKSVEEKRPVIIQASNNAEVDAALDLIAELDLSATLLFPGELKPFLTRLADQNVSVIVRPARPNDYAWFVDDCVAAIELGIPLAIAGDSPLDIRWTASRFVTAGLSESKAMEILTSTLQPMLAAEKDNSLAVESPANFVVWSDSPLFASARPLIVFSNGKAVEPLSTTSVLNAAMKSQAQTTISDDAMPQNTGLLHD